MLTNQIIQSTMDELHAVTGVDFFIYDIESGFLAATSQDKPFDDNVAEAFASSSSDMQSINGANFFKIMDDGEAIYTLISTGPADMSLMMGKVLVSQLSQLIVAYKERYDRNNFFQNLILDNMLLVDIYNKALKLHINNEVCRMVYMIETKNDTDGIVGELLKSMFVEQGGNYITAIDEKSLILVKEMPEGSSRKDFDEIANTIVDMLGSEAMIRVRVSYGLPVNELKEVSKCYKEAKMAMDVGEIFYSQKTILSYETLGIGRLIYQLPISLCKIFVNEVFGDYAPSSIDEETLITVNTLFENNMNMSETAKQLFIHRNTLAYRMEKLQNKINLDMKVFDDALTFKIAMMVVDYINYLEKNENN